jgi:hypothetical protein
MKEQATRKCEGEIQAFECGMNPNKPLTEAKYRMHSIFYTECSAPDSTDAKDEIRLAIPTRRENGERILAYGVYTKNDVDFFKSAKPYATKAKPLSQEEFLGVFLDSLSREANLLDFAAKAAVGSEDWKKDFAETAVEDKRYTRLGTWFDFKMAAQMPSCMALAKHPALQTDAYSAFRTLITTTQADLKPLIAFGDSWTPPMTQAPAPVIPNDTTAVHPN